MIAARAAAAPVGAGAGWGWTTVGAGGVASSIAGACINEARAESAFGTGGLQ